MISAFIANGNALREVVELLGHVCLNFTLFHFIVYFLYETHTIQYVNFWMLSLWIALWFEWIILKHNKQHLFYVFWTSKYTVNLSHKNFWTSLYRALEHLSTNLLCFFSMFLFSPEMHSLQYLNFSLFSLWISLAFFCIRRITCNWRSDVIFCHFKTCNWRSVAPQYKFWTVHGGARELLTTNLCFLYTSNFSVILI